MHCTATLGKNTPRTGAPEQRTFPRAAGAKEQTTMPGTPVCGPGSVKKASAPAEGQWGSHSTIYANERGTHETDRNTAVPFDRLGHCAHFCVRSNYASHRLLDPRNTAASRRPSDATDGDDKTAGPRAERGTAKSCSTFGKLTTRGHRSATSLIGGLGLRMVGLLRNKGLRHGR